MEWSDYTKLLIEKCKKRGVPSTATFELTPFCNFNCNMCYIRLSPEQAMSQGKLLSTGQWIDLAEETKRLGTFGLELTGGEALTRDDFGVLYERFIRLGYMVSLRTNGYLIRGENLDILKKYKPRHVSVTLYGGTNDTYQKVCGIKDGFSVVTENVLALRRAGIDVGITVTVTRDNINDRVLLIEWAKMNNFFITFYGGLITPIRSAYRSINHLKVNFLPIQDEKEVEIPARVISNRERYMNPFWMCREFGTRFCISWDGRMTLCNCLPSIWTDPLSKGVDNAFRLLNQKLGNVRRPVECLECQVIDYCGLCPSNLFSETGDHEKTCSRICNRAKMGYIASLKQNAISFKGSDKDIYLTHEKDNMFYEDKR